MIRGRVIAFAPRRHQALVEAPLRRYMPARGQCLTLANIRGPWRPSGAVAGMGVFAVVWETWRGTFWAPLHDFAPADQLRLVEACKRLDREAGNLGTFAEGGQ